jgi:hypothetical protein
MQNRASESRAVPRPEFVHTKTALMTHLSRLLEHLRDLPNRHFHVKVSRMDDCTLGSLHKVRGRWAIGMCFSAA